MTPRRIVLVILTVVLLTGCLNARDLANQHKRDYPLMVGMSAQDVHDRWGPPDETSTLVLGTGVGQRWWYRTGLTPYSTGHAVVAVPKGINVYLQNGRVVAIAAP